jgi:aminotransferase
MAPSLPESGVRVSRGPFAGRTQRVAESVIQDMSRMAARYGAINLAEGFPDFPCPDVLKQAADEVIRGDVNQYLNTWGDAPLREAIAEKVRWHPGLPADPEREITVTTGATEAIAAAILSACEPGDEVIVFEPFYEVYLPDIALAGGVPRIVSLHPPQWTLDEAQLRAAFNPRTRAIVINTPQNPTGKVFNEEELTLIAQLCQQWNVLAITDEVYEHILFDGHKHLSLASLPGMAERTVTISSLSKTYSVTGWRVGYAIASPERTSAIRALHDAMTGGAPAPLQRAGVTALKLPRSYYAELGMAYQRRRDHMLEILDGVGIRYFKPQGATFVFADIAQFGFKTDVEFVHFLIREARVVVVPASTFFSRPELGNRYVRLCFAKSTDTLNQAEERLAKLRDTLRVFP